MYDKELWLLKKRERFRERKIYENITDLASNDYLGLAENVEIFEKAYIETKKLGLHGSKASLLVNGYTKAHKTLENELKKLNGFEDAIVLGSGFLANMALFELGRRGDLFLVDSEYHASGIVGSRLTQANVRFFEHNSLQDLKEKSRDYKNFNRVFVVVEGIYSMRGDEVNPEILDYAESLGYLIIDEAHSVGVVGDNLMGVTDKYNLNPNKTIKMGTLGKALGSYGAYILAKKEITDFLINKAKSIIYTTALSPVDCYNAYFALKYIQKNISLLKNEIKKRKLIFNSDSLIKIIPAKSNKTLLEKQQKLIEDAKVLIGAIRPPTVSAPIFRVILRINVKEDIISKTIKFLEEK
ncbi:aminotransferase class I/II-fold pyridoxal phosphate-dependent enzyme [Caminibacter sp.]